LNDDFLNDETSLGAIKAASVVAHENSHRTGNRIEALSYEEGASAFAVIAVP